MIERNRYRGKDWMVLIKKKTVLIEIYKKEGIEKLNLTVKQLNDIMETLKEGEREEDTIIIKQMYNLLPKLNTEEMNNIKEMLEKRRIKLNERKSIS